MTRTPCYLFDITDETAKKVRAAVVRDWPSKRLVDVEKSWAPVRSVLKRKKDRTGMTIEHGHWDWSLKRESVVSGRHRLLAVEYAGAVQGLMAVYSYPRTARLNPKNELIYIDYVENAPWNIRRIGSRRRFGEIGRSLFAEAIRLSLDSGMQGRIGLHSLPGAEPFYRQKMKMAEFKPDRNYSHLRYFEFDAEASKRFLEGVIR